MVLYKDIESSSKENDDSKWRTTSANQEDFCISLYGVSAKFSHWENSYGSTIKSDGLNPV